jgi:phosphoribosyl-ATP pyrophosphohydrolase
MLPNVERSPLDNEADFCGEEYDNLYFLIMDLQQDGLGMSEILDLMEDRWGPQIHRLKEHGYLGGE